MQQFINNICDFIWEIIYSFYFRIRFPGNQNITTSLDITTTNWNTFLDKQIFVGELLNVGITWRELFNYLLPIIISILFIALFIRFIWSLLTIIKDSVTKWR